MKKSAKKVYYWVGEDGTGAIRLSTNDVFVYHQTNAVLTAKGYRKATAEEYAKAQRETKKLDAKEESEA